MIILNFIHYRLDEDDVKLMKRLMHGSGVCPSCYRPYKINLDGSTDRLHRWEIQLEIVSYYVFRLFVHIPMILILALPAIFGGFGSWITDLTKDSHKIESDDETEMFRNISTDEHYRSLVQNVINNELQEDIDLLSTQFEALYRKFNTISTRQLQYNLQLNKIESLLSDINKKLADDTEEEQIEIKHQEMKPDIAAARFKTISDQMFGDKQEE